MSCEDPDHMEMPVKCDCGRWCELNDMECPDPIEDEPLLCPACIREINTTNDDN